MAPYRAILLPLHANIFSGEVRNMTGEVCNMARHRNQKRGYNFHTFRRKGEKVYLGGAC